DLLEEVLAAQRADHARVVQQHADQVKRAEYEARLAQRQYQAVDPDHRLVAAELERRWELALRAVAEAREAAERLTTQPPEPTLDAAGYGDAAIAARLTAQGFRSARRRSGIGRTTVGKMRRAAVGLSVTHQFRSQDQIDGHWTVHGLARHLAVPRDWLYERIRNGT